jgi:hypothetical protein
LNTKKAKISKGQKSKQKQNEKKKRVKRGIASRAIPKKVLYEISIRMNW